LTDFVKGSNKYPVGVSVGQVVLASIGKPYKTPSIAAQTKEKQQLEFGKGVKGQRVKKHKDLAYEFWTFTIIDLTLWTIPQGKRSDRFWNQPSYFEKNHEL
jgi:hypothetical protein